VIFYFCGVGDGEGELKEGRDFDVMLCTLWREMKEA